MAAKKAITQQQKTPVLPEWLMVGEWTYDSIDPITGGIWKIKAGKETPLEELNIRVNFILATEGTKRPAKGTVAMLLPLNR